MSVHEMKRSAWRLALSRRPGLGLCLPVAEVLATRSASSASVAAFGPLRQNDAQLRVVSVLVHVVDAYMSLQVVRSGVAVLLVWAEWTAKSGSARSLCVCVVFGGVDGEQICLPDVAGTLVNEAMPDHLILPLESFPSGTSGALSHWTEVWSIRGMHVGVAVEQVLRLKRRCSTAGVGAFEGTRSKRPIGW